MYIQNALVCAFKTLPCVPSNASLAVELMWSARDAEDAGTAKRRRERRLRQFLRHERLTIAMLLAETGHNPAPRGQTKARTGGRGT